MAPSGKYKGKTLGQIKNEDPKYFVYMRSGIKDEDVKVRIQRMLDKDKPTAPAPMTAQLAQPGLVQPPPQATVVPVVSATTDPQRDVVVSEIRGIITRTAKFNGKGMIDVLIPLVKQTVGMIDYTDAPLPDLVKLKGILETHAQLP